MVDFIIIQGFSKRFILFCICLTFQGISLSIRIIFSLISTCLFCDSFKYTISYTSPDKYGLQELVYSSYYSSIVPIDMVEFLEKIPWFHLDNWS